MKAKEQPAAPEATPNLIPCSRRLRTGAEIAKERLDDELLRSGLCPCGAVGEEPGWARGLREALAKTRSHEEII